MPEPSTLRPALAHRAIGSWRQWLFVWVKFRSIRQAQQALDIPGPTSPSFAMACIMALGRCERGMGQDWARIALLAVRRCTFPEHRGAKAFEAFILWISGHRKRLPSTQFARPDPLEETEDLWNAALDLCEALLDSGAQPSLSMVEHPLSSWVIAELCEVLGAHRSHPEALIQSIMHPRPGYRSASGVGLYPIDGRLCFLALNALPNAWVETWLNPRVAFGRDDFLAHTLAWKTLGSGHLDEPGARLLRMLDCDDSPFSAVLRRPMSSSNLWVWRHAAADWSSLLDSAGRLGGWAWAADLLLFIDARHPLCPEGLPRSLSVPIGNTDWAQVSTRLIQLLDPPPEHILSTLKGRAGEAYLLQAQMRLSVAPGSMPSRSRFKSLSL